MKMHLTFAAAALAVGAITVMPAAAQYSGTSSTTTHQNTQSMTAGQAVSKVQAQINKLQGDMNRLRNTARAQVLAKPEWASIVAAKRKAEADLDSAHRAALATVHNRQEYKDLAKERDDAENQITASNSGGEKLSDADVQRLTNVIFNNGLAIRKMEQSALQDDPKYTDAKTQYDAANAKMADLDSQVDLALRDDKTYQTDSTQMEELKKQLATARMQLAQAIKSEEQQREAAAKARAQSGSSGGYSGGR